MTLKEFLNKVDFNDIRTDNQFYNSKPWFHMIRGSFLRFLRMWYARREILDDLETVQDVLEAIDLCFMSNTWKYDHLYSIYVAEYNPIWNYEGSETRTTDRDLSEQHTGEDVTATTGSDETARTGSDATTTTGGYKDQQAGKLQNDRTTFDSDVGYNTDGSTDTRSTERTYNQLKDTTNYNSGTETTYGKTDTTTYDSGRGVEEHVRETMTRGGNMGVTSTQTMMQQEIDIAGKLHLFEVIALDVINSICYS